MAKPDGCGLHKNKAKKTEVVSDGKHCVSINIYKSMSKAPCPSILKPDNNAIYIIYIYINVYAYTHI